LEEKILPMKIDLSKDGISMIFKDYQQLILECLWKLNKPTGTRELWDYVNKNLPKGQTISRAAVIFFANDMVDLGILDWDDETGKGGHHRKYYPILSEDEILERLRKTIDVKFGTLE